MPLSSLLFRGIAIISAIATTILYFWGEKQIKDLTHEIESQSTHLSLLHQQSEEKENSLQRVKTQLDKTSLKLANLKRDQKLKDNEVMLVTQELSQTREDLIATTHTNESIIEQNNTLRRANIELKSQGYDPQIDPKMLQAQIDQQQLRIHSLENTLTDNETVLKALFSNSNKTRPRKGNAQIERFLPNRNILVIEAGLKDGITKNLEFSLADGANLIAKVRAARVTSERSILKIVSKNDGYDLLREGAKIDYLL